MAIGNHTLPTELLRTCDEGIFYCISDWAYNITGGFWWTALLLGFCFALFMATIRLGTTRAFGFASVVGIFGSLFLATMKLMPWWIATVFILTGSVALAAMIMSKK